MKWGRVCHFKSCLRHDNICKCLKKTGLDFASYFEAISSCRQLRGAAREIINTATQCNFKFIVDTWCYFLKNNFFNCMLFQNPVIFVKIILR